MDSLTMSQTTQDSKMLLSSQTVDSDNLVKIIHYESCNLSSSPEVQKLRGVVLDEKDNTPIASSFGFTPELTFSDAGYQQMLDTVNFPAKVFPAYEGFVIRVYAVPIENTFKWMMSTHRRLDANKSYWGSETSHGEMFKSALMEAWINNLLTKIDLDDTKSLFTEFCNTLDPNFTYAFLVRNDEENRIVCDAPENPQLFLIGVFTRDGKFNQEVYNTMESLHPLCLGILTEDKTSPSLTDSTILFTNLSNKTSSYSSLDTAVSCIMNTLNDVENLKDEDIQGITLRFFVDRCEDCYESGGIIKRPCLTESTDVRMIKVLTENYAYSFSLRNNEPNLFLCYLRLRSEPKIQEEFLLLYQNRISEFIELEKSVVSLTHVLHQKYIKRWIFHNELRLPPRQFEFLVRCHMRYINSDRKTKVTHDIVVEEMVKTHAELVLCMLDEQFRK